MVTLESDVDVLEQIFRRSGLNPQRTNESLIKHRVKSTQLTIQENGTFDFGIRFFFDAAGMLIGVITLDT